MDYHQLANFIGERLPGTGVWLHSTPTEETEDQGETGQSCNPLAEGLAIRREDGPGTSPSPSKDRGSRSPQTFWMVLYFSIWSTLGDEGDEDDGDDGDDEDLALRIGFTQEYDTLGEAKAEARELVGYLPVPDSVGGKAARNMNNLLLEAIDDLEDEQLEGPG